MLKQSLHYKLSQKLSPQQIQLMKLIQLPTQAFEQRLKQELEENPALESGKDQEETYEESFDSNDNDMDNEQINADFKTDYKGVFGLYRLSKSLRNTQVDAVADLHNVLRTKVLKFFLPRIKFNQIDKGRAEKKALITAKKRAPLRTTTQRYADVFRSLGFEFEIDNPTFPAPKRLDAITTKKLGAFSNSSIGIAPFAAYASKTYSISKMGEVISKLQEKSKLLLF